jgi:multiple sugar transport system permease protein
MSDFSVTEPLPGRKRVAGALVALYAIITILPLVWTFATGFKSPADAIAYPPKLVFQSPLEGYVNLFTTQTCQTAEYVQSHPPETCDERIVQAKGLTIARPSRFGERFMNSVIIGFGSTFLSVCLGTLAAYDFSRFKVPLKDDLMFSILSTRMMPPIAVAIQIFLMFRSLGLSHTQAGMIQLYTAVNLSLSVWLLKGFIDEIPQNTRTRRRSTATRGSRPSARWCCRRRRRLRLALGRRGARGHPRGDRPVGLPAGREERHRRPAELRPRRRARPGVWAQRRDVGGR